VRRDEECATPVPRLTDGAAPVGSKIIHDDDVA
jgi:hypothetical protein